ncbi:MAG: hypothetical protein Q9161_003389 [Pseudevernia consocians]
MRTTFPAIATLLATPMALAFPQISPTSAASATVTPPSSYYLKTHVVGQGHNDKDGLYVSNYPTGIAIWAQSLCAGTADVTLQPIGSASPAFFNSGYQEFNLDPPEPFGITMGDYDNGGTAWNLVTTAPGYGDGGFFFNATGLQYESPDVGFAGWLDG